MISIQRVVHMYRYVCKVHTRSFACSRWHKCALARSMKWSFCTWYVRYVWFQDKKIYMKICCFPKTLSQNSSACRSCCYYQSGYCLRPLISSLQDNKLKCRWQLLTRNANVFQHKGGFLDKLVVRSLSRSRSLFMDGDMEITKKRDYWSPIWSIFPKREVAYHGKLTGSCYVDVAHLNGPVYITGHLRSWTVKR